MPGTVCVALSATEDRSSDLAWKSVPVTVFGNATVTSAVSVALSSDEATVVTGLLFLSTRVVTVAPPAASRSPEIEVLSTATVAPRLLPLAATVKFLV